MTERIRVLATVNGKPVDAWVEPHETLLSFLRERLGLTGAKLACDMQVCGACTVLVDGAPVSACTTLAVEIRDKDVLTVEGLAGPGGELHPLQKAFIRRGAFQCGFCTPGFLLGAKALLDQVPGPGREDILHYLKGHICRCTGYLKIVEAVQEAAAERAKAPGAPRPGRQGEGGG